MERAELADEPVRTPAQLEDMRDLESVITAALHAQPIDIVMLRRGVWTYVGEQRRAGASPGRIILTLTELIEQPRSTSSMEMHAVMRRVILWCVEAYFGQLGGELEDRPVAG